MPAHYSPVVVAGDLLGPLHPVLGFEHLLVSSVVRPAHVPAEQHEGDQDEDGAHHLQDGCNTARLPGYQVSQLYTSHNLCVTETILTSDHGLQPEGGDQRAHATQEGEGAHEDDLPGHGDWSAMCGV